ncbi:MAG: ATP-binding cassette domain-containing protein [Clostridia bacterium]|nr:ATP-binding cassette domain-containing protein [Clostridia bacterium]MBQ5743360.1 ATP-binding cassette domain-containing protein [Clostridia bacterium]
MIEVTGLTKRYGKKAAVDNLTFTVRRGEVIGFLGPNGAGKSTTMNMLTGYLAPTVGTIYINGYNLMDAPEKAKEYVGYLPEIPPLYMDMTVNEYLNFVYGIKKCKFPRREHLNEVCEVVRISHVRHRMIRNLSKGYRQRVGLAQALINDPKILILDEPTVGLDPKEIVEIRNLIQRLGQTRTVILSSHVLSEIQSVCERVIIINEGHLIADALTEDLARSAAANSRYAVRIAAPQDEVVPVLSAIPGMLKVELQGSMEPGTVDVMIEAEQDVDIRRALFEECAKRGWYILVITPVGVSLEDIFLQLVDQSSVQAQGDPLTLNEAEETETSEEKEEDAE